MREFILAFQQGKIEVVFVEGNPITKEDLKVLLPDILKLSEKEKIKKVRTLIRAYDPCISCAVHQKRRKEISAFFDKGSTNWVE